MRTVDADDKMDLLVPRSGTLDIRTKSKLAEYAATLRKQWEDEKAAIKPKWNYQKMCLSNRVVGWI